MPEAAGDPGSFRPEPPADTLFIEHDVHSQQCSHCGSDDLEATGRFEDHIMADIPEPQLDWQRFRRHVYRCRSCEHTCQGRGDLDLPGGPLQSGIVAIWPAATNTFPQGFHLRFDLGLVDMGQPIHRMRHRAGSQYR